MTGTSKYEGAMKSALAVAARAEAQRDEGIGLLGPLLRQPRLARLMRVWSNRRYQLPGHCPRLLRRIAAGRHRAPDETLELAELVLEIARRCRSMPERVLNDFRAEALAEIANAERIKGRLAEAGAALGEALAACEQGTDDPLLRAKIHRFRGCTYLDLCQHEEAVWEFRAAQRIYASLNDRHRAGRTLLALGTALRLAGNPEAAIVALYSGFLEVDSTREPHLAITTGLSLAEACADLGELDHGIQTLRLLRPLILLRPGGLLALRATYTEGKLLAASFRHKEALRPLRFALAAFRDAEHHRDAALVALDLAHSLASLGRLEELGALAGPLLVLLRHEEGLSGEASALMVLVARSFAKVEICRATVLEEVPRLKEALTSAFRLGRRNAPV